MGSNHASTQGRKNKNDCNIGQEQFPICAHEATTKDLQSCMLVPHPLTNEIAYEDSCEQFDAFVAILQPHRLPGQQLGRLQTWIHSFGIAIVQAGRQDRTQYRILRTNAPAPALEVCCLHYCVRS